MNESPYRGTTAECLEHFSVVNGFRGQKQSRESYQRRNQICALLDIGPRAGEEWFQKNILPLGTNLVCLRLFLELVGYQIVERENQQEINRKLADLIALGCLSIKESVAFLGVRPKVIRMLIAGQTQKMASKTQTGLLHQLVERFQPQEQKKLTEWKKQIAGLELRATRPSRPSPADSSTSVPNAASHGHVIESLAHLILAGRVLASEVISDSYSPEEREELRQKTQNGSSNAVFEFSNLLNRLCGERARREIQPSTPSTRR